MKNEVYLLAREVQDYLNEEGWSFCVVGGVANLRWGKLRLTDDVDFCVFSGFEHTQVVIDSLTARYPFREPRGLQLAQQGRVLILKSPETGLGFDIALGALPFEESMIGRSTLFDYGDGIRLRTCSAEDLVVMKCFASRPIDLTDVRGIVARQWGKLDMDYIRHWLREFEGLIDSKDPLGEFENIVAAHTKRLEREP